MSETRSADTLGRGDALLEFRFEEPGPDSFPRLPQPGAAFMSIPLMTPGAPNAWDCRILLDGVSALRASVTYTLPILFLSSDAARSALPVGTRVELMMGRPVGFGIIRVLRG